MQLTPDPEGRPDHYVDEAGNLYALRAGQTTSAFIAELEAAVAAEPARSAAVTARMNAFTSDTGVTDLLERLKSASVAQIDTWLTNNVTNLAQARTVLAAIIKVLAIKS